MSVLRMKKVFVIAHRHDQTAIADELQEAGLIEISEIGDEEDVSRKSEEKLYTCRADQLGLEVTKVEYVTSFLRRAKPPKSGMISGLVKDRPVVSQNQFNNIDKKLDFESLYKQCEDLDARLSTLQREEQELSVKRESLSPWQSMKIRFDQIKPSKYFELIIGQIKSESVEKLIEILDKEHPETDLSVISQKNQITSVAIFFFTPHRGAIERLLANNGFERVVFQDLKMTAAEETASIDERIQTVKERVLVLKNEVLELTKYSRDAAILADWLKGRQARYIAQSKFGQTDSTFVLQGWIEERKEDVLAKLLKGHEAIVDFSFADPEVNDRVPVLLRNHRWIRPFETLTRLYGMPNYNELDPTPIMAVFFFLFFGMSLGDFGYGFVLTAFCLWLKKRLVITDAGREWLTLFALGGVSSGIVGVLTGGYFGLNVESLPGALQGIMVINPLEQAFVFLMITWGLGVIHLMAGLSIEFWDSWRRRQFADAIYMTLGKMAILSFATVAGSGWFALTVFEKQSAFYVGLTSIGVSGLGLSSLVFAVFSGGAFALYLKTIARTVGRRFEKLKVESEDIIGAIILLTFLVLLAVGMSETVWGLAAAALLFVGAFVNKPARQLLISLFSGLYNLYGMTTYIGDVLSYSRLMALGLATFLIGFAINTIASLVVGYSPWGLPIGILLALVIAIPFHIFNIVINLLGAFVHPLRLQFVEFFGKFYENGGRAFKPLSFESDNLIFKEE